MLLLIVASVVFVISAGNRINYFLVWDSLWRCTDRNKPLLYVDFPLSIGGILSLTSSLLFAEAYDQYKSKWYAFESLRFLLEKNRKREETTLIKVRHCSVGSNYIIRSNICQILMLTYFFLITSLDLPG